MSDDSTDGEQAPGGGSEDDNVGDDAPASAGAAEPGGAAVGDPGIAPTWSSKSPGRIGWWRSWHRTWEAPAGRALLISVLLRPRPGFYVMRLRRGTPSIPADLPSLPDD